MSDNISNGDDHSHHDFEGGFSFTIWKNRRGQGQRGLNGALDGIVEIKD